MKVFRCGDSVSQVSVLFSAAPVVDCLALVQDYTFSDSLSLQSHTQSILWTIMKFSLSLVYKS